jgi:hypothetical protein
MTGHVAPNAKWDRNHEIIRLHRAGVSIAELARKYGISRVRVGQISAAVGALAPVHAIVRLRPMESIYKVARLLGDTVATLWGDSLQTVVANYWHPSADFLAS